MKYSIILLLFVFLNSIACSQNYQPTWESIDNRPIPGWFSDAKFGIFIHWGLYAVPAWGPTDASVYDKYAEWYWNKLTNKNSKVHDNFVAFHNETYGEDFKYQDFVKGFTCEMFEPADWAKIFKNSGS